MPFNQDFGPLNLAMVHRYTRELARLLQVSFPQNKLKRSNKHSLRIQFHVYVCVCLGRPIQELQNLPLLF